MKIQYNDILSMIKESAKCILRESNHRGITICLDFDDCFVDITRDDIPSLSDEDKDFYLGELLDFYYKHQQ